MPLLTFGPWRPDLPDVAVLDETNAVRLVEAENVIPDVGGYQPQASGSVQTDTLTSTCMGAFACLDASGNPNWIAGSATSLERIFSNTSTWTTVGGPYALTDEDRWEFAKYGNQIFATAITNDLQFMTMSAGATFAAVGGSPPRARHIAVVRGFVVLANVAAAAQRVQWSALENPQSWTVDATTQSDFQDLFGPGGWNQGIVVGLAGADAVVIQEHTIWRMMYVGTPLIFQFDPVENSRGAIAPGSIVQSGGYVFFIGDDGFYRFDGTTSVPIGHGKVDDFFFADVDTGKYNRITAVADADRTLVMWSYQSVSSSQPDKVLVYNWHVEEWSLLTIDCELVWRALKITDPPGKPVLAAFTTTHRATIFLSSGTSTAAKIETADYQFNQKGRALVTAVYPVLEGASPRTLIRHRPNATVSLTASADYTSVNTQGFSPLRVDDRFMRISQRISLGTTWSKWRGFKIETTPTGER